MNKVETPGVISKPKNHQKIYYIIVYLQPGSFVDFGAYFGSFIIISGCKQALEAP
jgi:hypothetical protein